MKRFIAHMHTKSTHDRRTHAMQIAGALTAIVFVVWVTTLGIRIATPSGGETTLQATGGQTSLTAAAAQTQNNNEARLEVATSSVLSLPQYSN
jgi:hypothetical protein